MSMGARGQNIVHFHCAYKYARYILFHLWGGRGVLTIEHGSERIEDVACFAHFPYFECFAYFAYLHFANLIFTSGGEVLTNERGGESTED